MNGWAGTYILYDHLFILCRQCNGLVCDSYCRIDDLDGKGLTTCLTGSGLDAELFIYQ